MSTVILITDHNQNFHQEKGSDPNSTKMTLMPAYEPVGNNQTRMFGEALSTMSMHIDINKKVFGKDEQS